MLQSDIISQPVITFVDQLIQSAIDEQASDIHIEPQAHHYRIRIRRDGFLSEYASIASHYAKQVIIRLKMLAHLNIAEARLPQDGYLRSDHNTDMRVSTCPTLHGEKIVLRLFPPNQHTRTLTELGMTSSQQSLFIEKLHSPQGLILATGSTGSGKTTTLYAALHYLNRIEKNILTVEDPIEIQLPGINQINVHPQIGFTFAKALRTLLRQDPDVIMIGEIRDRETAGIAMQAAQTGHLVLSTLHTNCAKDTLLRLKSLGISPRDLNNTIALIVGQQLVASAHGRTGSFECWTYHTSIDSHAKTTTIHT